MSLQLGFHIFGFLAQTPAASIFVFENYVETEVFKETPNELHSKWSYSDWDLEQALDKTIVLSLFLVTSKASDNSL